MTAGWFSLMALFVTCLASLWVWGLDIQEGRRQTQVVALSVARVLATTGAPCIQYSSNDNEVYDCLVQLGAVDLPSRQALNGSSQAVPVQFGSYDTAFNPNGTVVNAVSVTANTTLRQLLGAQVPHTAIVYFTGGVLTLAPDPAKPL